MPPLVICDVWRHGTIESLAHVLSPTCVRPRHATSERCTDPSCNYAGFPHVNPCPASDAPPPPPWVVFHRGDGTADILPAMHPGTVLAGVPLTLAHEIVRAANAWASRGGT